MTGVMTFFIDALKFNMVALFHNLVLTYTRKYHLVCFIILMVCTPGFNIS